MSNACKYLVAAIVAASGLGMAPVRAQDGLADIHEWVQVRGKTCMKDHFHSGSSSGLASKKQAETEAVSGWSGFTAWEYGDHWGRWRLAESRSVKCSKDGSSWSCTVDARPCKPGRR